MWWCVIISEVFASPFKLEAINHDHWKKQSVCTPKSSCIGKPTTFNSNLTTTLPILRSVYTSEANIIVVLNEEFTARNHNNNENLKVNAFAPQNTNPLIDKTGNHHYCYQRFSEGLTDWDSPQGEITTSGLFGQCRTLRELIDRFNFYLFRRHHRRLRKLYIRRSVDWLIYQWRCVEDGRCVWQEWYLFSSNLLWFQNHFLLVRIVRFRSSETSRNRVSDWARISENTMTAKI